MLTKSNFLAFQHCPKSFWLAARRPELIRPEPISAFAQKILADGYAVERAFGELVGEWPDATRVRGQVTFEIDDLFAKADFVRSNEDGSIDIFEVKGSTSLKEEGGSDHIADVTFQTIVAERTGEKVNAAYIVHLNRDYVRHGALDLRGLLTIVDVTARVRERAAEIDGLIAEALRLLSAEQIDENGCTCIYFGNPDRRCEGFDHFNREIPEHSIYLLPRISAARVTKFVDSGRLSLADVDPGELTPAQRAVREAALLGAPVIDREAIRDFLAQVRWPIHFYDYETCNPPIPVADGHWPSRQIPVQYSLHVLHEDGRLDHREWLATGYGAELELIESMEEGIGEAGSAMVWYETFEKSRNRELGKAFPEKAAFFDRLNERTIDLMKPFVTGYVDIRFGGSTSIKKVLPVVCPDLRYNPDAVHDGTGAIEAWMRMVESTDVAERSRLRRELLDYCRLDTLAMVEIFRFLCSIA